MDKPLALPPPTGTDVVPARGTDVVPAAGTDVIPMITRADVARAHAELPKPAAKEIPKARERDPDRLTPGEARRLINRVRRTRFFLWVPVSVFESPYKGEFEGWRSTQFMQVTAAQLMDLLKEVERNHVEHYVRVRHNQDTMYVSVN